jgi:hypothetical protein
MSGLVASIKRSVVLALASVPLFTTSASGQSPTVKPTSIEKGAAAAQEPLPAKPQSKTPAAAPNAGSADKQVTTEKPERDDLRDEIEAIKAENAAVRELLRKMEEQQKTLLERVDLWRTLTDPPVVTNPATSSVQPASVASVQPASNAEPQKNSGRYKNGIVIWQTPDDVEVPFLLKLNNNTQVRYLNSLKTADTFTDHLGNVFEFKKRNDITVNRSMFILGGYIFNKKVIYSLTVWTSAGAASIVVAGNIGWEFNRYFTLIGGYTGVPGSRSLVNTFPYWTAMDRMMADNFFRPAFTQGVWATGELPKALNYLAFLGNGLNTLNISASKIDTSLVVSGSVWWEPLGMYGEPGKAVNQYDDYFGLKKVRIRIGTSFTRSPEDRFSDLDQNTPDNTSQYNSDGVLVFSTGAFAPGVTVQRDLYKMSAIDGGLKYNGFAINGQYYMRWLSNFEADGPMPVTSTFDRGYELSASYFVIPKTLAPYVRGSQVFGQFGNSYEYAAGAKWYFLPTDRLWLASELMRVHKSPYGAGFTPYTAGMNGWVPMVQSVIAF